MLPDKKLQAVERQRVSMKGKPFGEVRQALGENYSCGEIRTVLAQRNHLAAGDARKS